MKSASSGNIITVGLFRVQVHATSRKESPRHAIHPRLYLEQENIPTGGQGNVLIRVAVPVLMGSDMVRKLDYLF